MYEGLSTGKKRAAKRLVKIILSDPDNMISVYDGEEWAIKRSRNTKDILDALGNTDYDDINVRSRGTEELELAGNFRRKGWFSLVWCNSEDGSDLISDYLDNEFSDNIWNEWNKCYE